jgi:argininosuccinate synthase
MGGVPLGAARDAALAAGAARCHALDVREELARECLIPALHRRTHQDPVVASQVLALSFVRRKLEEVARLEDAGVVMPAPMSVAPRPLPPAAADPIHLHIDFRDGVPVSVNGIEMTLTELMESIETITGEPALRVLDREITRSRELQFA